MAIDERPASEIGIFAIAFILSMVWWAIVSDPLRHAVVKSFRQPRFSLGTLVRWLTALAILFSTYAAGLETGLAATWVFFNIAACTYHRANIDLETSK